MNLLYPFSIDRLTPELIMLGLAIAWDTTNGDPRKFHPVSGIGSLIGLCEKAAPKKGKALPFIYGLGMAVLLPLALAVAVYFLMKGLRGINIIAYIVVGAVLLKSCFAVRGLSKPAQTISNRLEKGNLPEARKELRSLVRRDAEDFDEQRIASAAVESVAENIPDSFLSPWLFFAFFGIPGAVAYRTVNTLDSMVGYHGRYEYLGKASARLDDLVNLVPTRLSALLIILASWPLRLNVRKAWRTMWHEHGETESPNAGWTMSAMAGALDVELEKPGHYRLGTALHPVSLKDIRLSIRVMWMVAALGFIITLALLVVNYGFIQL